MIPNKPQKAPSKPITNQELEGMTFPLLCSPKLDGYRCVSINNVAYTSSLKPVSNRYIQALLSQPEYDGMDGEIVVGVPNDPSAFNNTTGAVRRTEGEPDFKLYVFDRAGDDRVYSARLKTLIEQAEETHYAVVIEQRPAHSLAEVLDYEALCIEQGYEGAMVRSPQGRYKHGRCTAKEGNIFKRKPVEDDEAVIIGVGERQENHNDAFNNELGFTSRSSHQSGKVGVGTMGRLILRSNLWNESFCCGTGIGMNDDLRARIWANPKLYIGQTVTYKYQAHGSINAPRQPIFKGFRDLADIG